MDYIVKRIPSRYAYEWLTIRHYAKRVPNIMFCFGLFDKSKNNMVGVITYGMPPTPFLSRLFNKGTYLELNRLIINDELERNTCSFFISNTLKALGQIGNYVIVSYADPNQGHCGCVYQATNWIYTGAGRVNQKDKRGVNKYFYDDKEFHERHLPETMVRLGFNIDKTKTKNENWIDNGGLIIPQLRKHRYFYIVGDKKFKKESKRKICSHFDIYKYPKMEKQTYDASQPIKTINLDDIDFNV